MDGKERGGEREMKTHRNIFVMSEMNEETLGGELKEVRVLGMSRYYIEEIRVYNLHKSKVVEKRGVASEKCAQIHNSIVVSPRKGLCLSV